MKLRICSYNILHGMMTEGDEGMIGRALKETGADVVGLQEVDIGTERVGGRDVLRTVAEAVGYPYYAFARAIPLGTGEYGTAVLSRYPILDFTVHPLPSDPDVEGRSFGHAVIDVNGETMHFLNTHVAFEHKTARGRHLSAIAEYLRTCPACILTGDFNTEDMEELAVFEGYETVNPRRFGTYYPRNIAIDHIFLPAHARAEHVEMPELPLSDHYPLVADVTVQ